MQAVPAELSGYAGKFRCFLGEKSFKQLGLIRSFLKRALGQTWSVCTFLPAMCSSLLLVCDFCGIASGTRRTDRRRRNG
jgi:hypothetical protein